MRIGAYCRVSTLKDAQLESLEHQTEFFESFCQQNGYELVEVYGERKTAKQTKNRTEFQRMMKDAEKRKFDMILVKDVSRFARNTEDFLHNIRKIKSWGIDIYFMGHGMKLQEASEAYLTILAAMAQDESARLSEKVKFGKNMNAKRGRVPNFVFGYDKIDTFTLKINEKEKEIVEQIFDLFVNKCYGTAKIAGWLNEQGIKTKRTKKVRWHQMVVTQILRNKIYIGKIVNKKSEIVDFITGKRQELPTEQQIVVDRPELRIISDELFFQAQKILEERKDKFNLTNKRESTKYPFSNLIKCSECGYSFRRLQRQYKEGGKVYKRWVDSARNSMGKDACCNKVIIDEEMLLEHIKEFLNNIIKNKRKFKDKVAKKVQELSQKKTINEKEIQKQIDSLQKEKEKYKEMFKNDIITIEELKQDTKPIDEQISQLKLQLNIINNEDKIGINIDKYFKNIEEVIQANLITNELLKRIISKIVIHPNGEVKIYNKTEVLLDSFTVPLKNDSTHRNYKMEWCFT